MALTRKKAPAKAKVTGKPIARAGGEAAEATPDLAPQALGTAIDRATDILAAIARKIGDVWAKRPRKK